MGNGGQSRATPLSLLSHPNMSDDSPSPRFFNPMGKITVGHNRLPHWDQQGSCYFITFRLFDSVPAALMAEHRRAETAWLASHPEPWTPEVELEYRRAFHGQVERWLDQGHGDCLLRQPECGQIIATALGYHEGVRTRLHGWVVMPNHVHVLTEICVGWDLPGLLKSWKGFTANAINHRLGRTGPLWQKGYYDRIIRDWDHFEKVVRYIRRNPANANLPEGAFLIGESALAAMFGVA
jgi:putative transposase